MLTKSVTKLSICIATYKRTDYLNQLLESISKLRFKKKNRLLIKIIIVDNDINKSAKKIIERWRKHIKYEIIYFIESKKGIPFVRNKLVSLSKNDDLIAFVDDDEIVSINWLEKLYTAYLKYKADAIMGPVIPKYEEKPPQWMIKYRIHFSKRYSSGEIIKYLNTGNILINRRKLDNYKKPFDERMAFTGGTDTLLGEKMINDNMRIIWENNAIVKEFIPKERIKISWLIKRRFRMGNVSYIIEKMIHSHQRKITIIHKIIMIYLKGTIKIPLGFFLNHKFLYEGLCHYVELLGLFSSIIGIKFNEYEKR